MTPSKDLIFTGSHVMDGGAGFVVDDASATAEAAASAADAIEPTATKSFMYAAKPNEVLSIPLTLVSEGMREADTERFLSRSFWQRASR